MSGILTQRKSWRIVGAADLVMAWMVAAVALVAGIGRPTCSSFSSLRQPCCLPTTLTQANESVLMDD